MSPKPSITIDHQCRHISPKGNRCHMLIDENHRPPQGTSRPKLCAYHADRLRVTIPIVEPEVLAADLLGDIQDFSTPGSVNLFLGNLVKQLACKRIARRDAIALAYISQLLLNSFPALERAAAAEKKAAEEKETARIDALIRQQARERAARRLQHPPIAPSSFALTGKRLPAQVKTVQEVRRNRAASRLIAPSQRSPCSGGSLDPCPSELRLQMRPMRHALQKRQAGAALRRMIR